MVLYMIKRPIRLCTAYLGLEINTGPIAYGQLISCWASWIDFARSGWPEKFWNLT